MNQPITGVGLRSHSVVIIDQDTEIRSRTARILRTGQYAVHETATIDEARKYLTETTPDAIILDIRWAPAESRAFIEDIKNSSRLRSTPVLVITPPSSEFTAHEVIKMGANDYIEKSQLESILLAKLDTHLHYRQTLLLLERSNQMLAYFAAFDELTGLYNRRAFTEAMRVEVKQMAEAGSCIAVLMIDVDNFKPINDRFGHHTGDETLRKTAKLLQGALREGDLLGRWGGDEFCAMLPQIDSEEAVSVTERLRSAVANAHMTADNGEQFSVTVSIGIAWSCASYVGQEPILLKAADKALYEAKNLGRNRIVLEDIDADA